MMPEICSAGFILGSKPPVSVSRYSSFTYSAYNTCQSSYNRPYFGLCG
jgi:hypothetical protein